MNIDALDFKHLSLLDTLLRTRSVTDAARFLDIPQSSASHGLSRLREALNDQLLVRSSGGMEPTPRAVAIAGVVSQILQLKQGLGGSSDTFNPASLDREFVIASSDIGQLIALSKLHQATHTSAPHLRFTGRTLTKDEMVLGLETGSIDLAFGAYPKLTSGVLQQSLYNETYRCYAHPDHPFAVTKSYEAFMEANHAVISTKGIAHAHRDIERQLVSLIDRIRIRIVTSSFFVALNLAAMSDLVLTAPGTVVEALAGERGLVAIKPPVAIKGFNVKQYWHARNQDDPAHQFFRRTIFDAFRTGPSRKAAGDPRS